MSKILKRPMFRRGGEVGGGIMSGIQTRSNYNVGGIGSDAALIYRAQNSVPTPPIKAKSPNIGIPSIGLENRMGRYSKVLRSALAPASSISPVAKFLITGGLKGLSQTGGGSTLANLAKAFEGPTAQLFTDLDAEGKQGQDIDLTAAQLAIKGEQEMEKARQSKEYESGTLAAITKEIQSALGKNAVSEEAQQLAVNLSPKIGRIQYKIMQGSPIQYQGILKMNEQNPGEPDLNWVNSQPDGSVFLNPYDRLFYIKTVNEQGQKELQVADQNTYTARKNKDGA